MCTMLASPAAEKVSRPSVQPVQKTATGISALSIWMKLTDRYMYAALPSHSVPACCWPDRSFGTLLYDTTACLDVVVQIAGLACCTVWCASLQGCSRQTLLHRNIGHVQQPVGTAQSPQYIPGHCRNDRGVLLGRQRGQV